MIKLYEKNSFMKECGAEVVSCEVKENKVYIKLNQSIFFPEEGGQHADAGILEYSENGELKQVKVIDGQIKTANTVNGQNKGVQEEIIYEVESEIQVGIKVLCKLDWTHRYDKMQNHSGEHILSGLINDKFGFNNIGFHLSDEGPVSLVVDGSLIKEQVAELEIEANKVIYENLPIVDTYPSKEELANISYRSKIDIDGQVRLITIGEGERIVDICACCAPHVARTGEIGILKVINIMKAKGGTQISILCGRRALEYINHNLETLNTVANAFSTHPDNVPQIVEGLKNENIKLKSELSDYKEKGIIAAIISKQVGRCAFSNEELSAQNMKNIFNVLVENNEGYVGLFVGNDNDGYRYYAGGQGLNAKELAGKMREKLGAKGGGSEEMIQGKIDSKQSEIEEFWSSL